MRVSNQKQTNRVTYDEFGFHHNFTNFIPQMHLFFSKLNVGYISAATVREKYMTMKSMKFNTFDFCCQNIVAMFGIFKKIV